MKSRQRTAEAVVSILLARYHADAETYSKIEEVAERLEQSHALATMGNHDQTEHIVEKVLHAREDADAEITHKIKDVLGKLEALIAKPKPEYYDEIERWVEHLLDVRAGADAELRTKIEQTAQQFQERVAPLIAHLQTRAEQTAEELSSKHPTPIRTIPDLVEELSVSMLPIPDQAPLSGSPKDAAPEPFKSSAPGVIHDHVAQAARPVFNPVPPPSLLHLPMPTVSHVLKTPLDLLSLTTLSETVEAINRTSSPLIFGSQEVKEVLSRNLTSAPQSHSTPEEKASRERPPAVEISEAHASTLLTAEDFHELSPTPSPALNIAFTDAQPETDKSNIQETPADVPDSTFLVGTAEDSSAITNEQTKDRDKAVQETITAIESNEPIRAIEAIQRELEVTPVGGLVEKITEHVEEAKSEPTQAIPVQAMKAVKEAAIVLLQAEEKVKEETKKFLAPTFLPAPAAPPQLARFSSLPAIPTITSSVSPTPDAKGPAERALETQPWREHTAKSGRKYWHNTQTKLSVWEMPEAYLNALSET